MIFSLTRIKHEVKFFIFLLLFTLHFTLFTSPASAIVDPLSSPNNKFGIHIIGANADEASPAAALVNSSGGDWGYITVLIESKNRDQKAWQKFFDDLRRRHLIPIVRIATEPVSSPISGQAFWKLPYEGEEVAWADFLDSLVWPVKNRYVVIYNEPNHALEWGNKVDAVSYARVLDKTITALKSKNDDFFVLNAGLDASAPNKLPFYQDEVSFTAEMESAVPGIFNRLDGWVSHSYPNPNFAGSPDDYGKGTVWTWEWEREFLEGMGVKKLPIFITETGWKHAEGIKYDSRLPSVELVSRNFKEAFTKCWIDSAIVAVTPFLLTYQEEPFDRFSFKKHTGESQNEKILPAGRDILGVEYPDYYPMYQAIQSLPKVSGRPAQENKADLSRSLVYSTIVAGENYDMSLAFKNTGQSIWNEYDPLELRAIQGGETFNITPVRAAGKIEPGNEVTLNVRLKASEPGKQKLSLQLFAGSKPFDDKIYQYDIEAKSPVALQVFASLPWKKDFSGEYLLKIVSDVMSATAKVILDQNGISAPLEGKYLLPDYNFDFTLYKPFYKPKTVGLKLKPGENKLDFGTLEPDFLSALTNPKEFWRLILGD